MKTGYIAGISRGHNASVCLLKDGEMIFCIEEERLTRKKYDGGPYACILKILEYTKKLDYCVIAHTQPDDSRTDYIGGTVYENLLRKFGLIDNKDSIIDVHQEHHKMHSYCGFYNSGFDEALTFVVDGAGTFIPSTIDGDDLTLWEIESVFYCKYPDFQKQIYKHLGGRGPMRTLEISENDCDIFVDDGAGIVKAYEAVTQYCGWYPIEAGKTMGLFPYGKNNYKIPNMFTDDDGTASRKVVNRSLIIPTYPNGAVVNSERYPELKDDFEPHQVSEKYNLQNRKDLAYRVQIDTQKQVLNLIQKYVEKTNVRNVVLTGGYALNCVANYYYLDELRNIGVNLYVEPISNDAGTSIGAANFYHRKISGDTRVNNRIKTLYHGPKYEISEDIISNKIKNYDLELFKTDNNEIVEHLRNKKVIAMFQGRSENGPRALGNRSIIFDPTFEDGKDYVNRIKKREFFRPFAATILHEEVNDWFNMKSLDESPFMMYAVNCKTDKMEKIPSVVHIDGTCRVQTLKRNQNENFYELIKSFYDKTGIPLLFNTSFNLGGQPLVETIDDAIDTFYNSKIDLLYFPEIKMTLRKMLK